MERVFSYGTLQLARVQETLYGGPVPTTPDTLLGFRLDELVITDPQVIAQSGKDRHPILRPGNVDGTVDGSCLEPTAEQLRATDDYEVDDYTRVACRLASGLTAWAYVDAS